MADPGVDGIGEQAPLAAAGAAASEPRQERTTCFYQGYKYTRAWASSRKISFRCSKFRSGCKGTTEFRIDCMSYSSVRPYTCRNERVASGLADVQEDMKEMADTRLLATLRDRHVKYGRSCAIFSTVSPL
ncbi:uncharacterized protein IUM83_03794 [Phytophthora cinnamomi]|uniref:uncharacterized protein n=1 Tax=Phytophthora cinnamomi TaxID=4785 RepID=UPI0035596C9F|nr:hypothetical protein IUM83_03794 [Phytophthora cinnamomi]